MPKVTNETPKIVTLLFKQEQSDPDYGSCLWARFNFDLKNYHLSIDSDCGNYSHGWIPTPATESFLELCARFDGEYLIYKMSDRSIIDGDQTLENVKELIEEYNTLDEFAREEIDSACHSYIRDETGTVYAITDALHEAGIKNITMYDISCCVEKDYSNNAKKIAEIYTKYIRPAVRDLVPEYS